MGKVVKILIGLAVLSGAVVGAYAWLQSRDGSDDGLKKIEIVTGASLPELRLPDWSTTQTVMPGWMVWPRMVFVGWSTISTPTPTAVIVTASMKAVLSPPALSTPWKVMVCEPLVTPSVAVV